MSSKKTSIPAAPTFQTDPNVSWSQDRLKEQYGYLMQGLTQEGQSLGGGLGEATNISPEISRLSQQYAQSQLDPAYRQKRQDTINTLEANNQLTGSTTASSLSNLDADYMASLTGMQAQYGLADVERALNNRVQLYTTGLQAGQSVGSTGLQNQNQINQFALANYENQVSAALMNQSSGSNWLGSLATGLGTAIGYGVGSNLTSQSPSVQSLSGTYATPLNSQTSGLNVGSKYSNPFSASLGSESVYDTTAGYSPYALNSYTVGLR